MLSLEPWGPSCDMFLLSAGDLFRAARGPTLSPFREGWLIQTQPFQAKTSKSGSKPSSLHEYVGAEQKQDTQSLTIGSWPFRQEAGLWSPLQLLQSIPASSRLRAFCFAFPYQHRLQKLHFRQSSYGMLRSWACPD